MNTHAAIRAGVGVAVWALVGDQFDDDPWCLVTCDDWPGLGPQLFAGGWFRHVGAVEANSIARWDETGWAPLGAGVNLEGEPLSFILDMVFVPDAFGDGPALFAGGIFDTAGGSPAMNVARWDGENWSALGIGLDGAVEALAWFDDGSGPALYAAGSFPDIMRWDGSIWTALDTGLDLDASAVAVHDDGSGSALFVSGSVPAEGGSVGIVARWDGIAWAQVGATFDSGVHKLGASEARAIVSVPGEAAMYAGGLFRRAGDIDTGYFARWDGSTWSAIGNGAAGGGVYALEGFDDGTGPGLYAGGSFVSAGGIPAASIVRWDGSHGTPVGGGIDGFVVAMEVVTDPAIGPGLYVAGQFDQAGTTAAASIARWDGTAWSALAGGVPGVVYALTVFDDGSGPALFVGGDFSAAGGVAAENVARWDGRQWAAVGYGLPGEIYLGVRALAVFDDGSGAGPALYAGGDFYREYPSKGSGPEGLARLDGDRWQPIGDGMTGVVHALKVFDDGTGPALFVGGSFCTLPDDDLNACNLARWDGSGWSDIPMPGPVVLALEAYDDGTGFGPRLYAGGSLYYFSDPALLNVGAWDGKAWTPLATGVGEPYGGTAVYAITAFDDGLGDGEALYLGGVFETAGDLVSNSIARWGGCGSFVLGDLTGDGVVGIDDFNTLLAGWGPCPEPCSPCPADLDGDCNVGIADFLILLANWTL